MSYLVFCVIDLKNARREDYHYAYMDLADLGLRRTLKSENGPSFGLPAPAVMGFRDGGSADEVKTLLGKSVRDIFKTRGLNGTFFVVVGGDWASAGDSL
jgi:hypothetical protein